MNVLSTFIASQTGRPFSLQAAHCLDFVADWLLLHGMDARTAWRGQPSRGATLALMADPDALLLSTAAAARCLGLTETDAPAPGDIGLVRAQFVSHRRPTLVGAIRGDGLWYVKTARGVQADAYASARAWSLPAQATLNVSGEARSAKTDACGEARRAKTDCVRHSPKGDA
ncbi:DUF6950 family protein [Bradyrhizobium sp. HKCCYLRH3099]|uniref:DUF6950 family protein n=1 Tax=unclassified Bradyrhizobium TaxID=2631580 RepID=UPI003EC0A4AE